MNRHKVYFVEFMALHGKDHHAIYVVTDDVQKTGNLYHVIGSTLMGMEVEIKAFPYPEEKPTFKKKTLIGCVRKQDLSRVKETCLLIPPPRPQHHLNGKRIYPHEPLRTCQEWIQEVIEVLRRDSIIA